MTTPRKLTADDLWSFKEMGNIALSPDGRRVAYVMYSLDKLKNERHGIIYLLQLDEQGQAVGEPRQLTSGVKNDTNPVWAPDSRRLLFLSDREEDIEPALADQYRWRRGTQTDEYAQWRQRSRVVSRWTMDRFYGYGLTDGRGRGFDGTQNSGRI